MMIKELEKSDNAKLDFLRRNKIKIIHIKFYDTQK